MVFNLLRACLLVNLLSLFNVEAHEGIVPDPSSNFRTAAPRRSLQNPPSLRRSNTRQNIPRIIYRETGSSSLQVPTPSLQQHFSDNRWLAPRKNLDRPAPTPLFKKLNPVWALSPKSNEIGKVIDPNQIFSGSLPGQAPASGIGRAFLLGFLMKEIFNPSATPDFLIAVFHGKYKSYMFELLSKADPEAVLNLWKIVTPEMDSMLEQYWAGRVYALSYRNEEDFKKQMKMISQVPLSHVSLGLIPRMLTDRQLENLTLNPKIQTLGFNGQKLNPGYIFSLLRMKKLTALSLKNCQFVHSELASTLSSSELTLLDLSNTAVDDNFLFQLDVLQNLRLLDLRGTGVSEAAVIGLESRNPNLIVILKDSDLEKANPENPRKALNDLTEEQNFLLGYAKGTKDGFKKGYEWGYKQGEIDGAVQGVALGVVASQLSHND